MTINDVEAQPPSVGGNANVELSTRPSSCLPMTSSTKWRQVRGSGLRQTSRFIAIFIVREVWREEARGRSKVMIGRLIDYECS